MQVITPQLATPLLRGSALTIGAYDGVHLGHQHVLAALRHIAVEQDLEFVVVTFDRHPLSLLRPNDAPLQLTDLPTKLELLATCGVQTTCVVPFTPERAVESAEQFIDELLIRQLRVSTIMVGENFRFGHDRRGDVAMLAAAGQDHGFTVTGIPLRDDDDGVISSTRIRGLVAHGDVEGASRLLGRPFSVVGTVVHGDGRGGPELGFPTANLHLEQGLAQPGDGIYAAWAYLADGSSAMAAVSIGRRPTFYEDAAPLIEAHLLDFAGDLYGLELKLSFVARLRGEERYDTIDALIEQIARDVHNTRIALEKS